MAIVSISRIQHRRGLQQDLPLLASAELGWSLDSQRLYIGNGSTAEGAPRTGITEILTEHSDVLTLAETYSFKNQDAGYTPTTGGKNSKYNAIAYGNSKYVAVGVNGSIIVSTDTVIWTPVFGGTSNTLNSICFGNGLFVAVGANGTIIYSSDGFVWNKSLTSIFLELTSVTYAGGTITSFIATSTTGNIIISPDAATWSSVTSGTSEGLYGIGYDSNFIVAVGNAGTIVTSANGTSWTLQTYTQSYTSNGSTVTATLPTSYNLKSANWVYDRWVVTGEYSTVLTSTDGMLWSYGFTDTFRAMAHNNTLWAIVGDGGIIYYINTTLTSNTPVITTSPTQNNLYDVLYSTHDAQFVAVGANGTIITSINGISWSTKTSGTTNNLRRIIYDSVHDLYIAVGDAGTIITSNDAITWTTRTSGVTANLNGIGLWAGTTTYIAVGQSGTALTSQNGITWVTRTTGISNDLNSVTVGNNRAVAVGNGGVVLTSDATGSIIGSTWVTRSSGAIDDLHHVNYLEWTINSVTTDNFFAVGNNATLIYSTDATTWITGSTPTSNHLFNIQYGIGNFWMTGSVGYTTIYGINAKNLNTLNQQSLAILQNNTTGVNGPTLYNSVFGNNYYVLVGQYDTIMNSLDGTNYISRTARSFIIQNLTTADISDIIYDNNIFTAVGNKGVILSSDTSNTWSGTSYTFGSNTTIRTIQRKLDDFVSVKDFGAKGDGITDDTESINRALYEIYCRNGIASARKVLHFPAGNYIVSDGVNVPTNAIIKGEGANNTIITQTADPTYISYVITTADNKQQVGGQIGYNGAGLPSDIIISDIGLQSSADGFWLVDAKRVTLDRVSIIGATDLPTDQGLYQWSGIYINGPQLGGIQDINFNDCYISKFNYGVYQPDTETSSNIIFNSVTFTNMYTGLYLCQNGGQINTMTISNCIFDLIYNRAIDANYVTNITSTFNSYKDVANEYGGTSNPVDYVINFGNQSISCASINDQFDRSYDQNLSTPWINGNNTSSGWFGGYSIKLGYFTQQGGNTYSLLANQTNQTTGVTYTIDDDTFNQKLQYVIVRDNVTRTGVLQLVYNVSTKSYSIDDDSIETGDVGVIFKLTGDGTTLTLLYTSTSTSSTNFTLSTAATNIKTVW